MRRALAVLKCLPAALCGLLVVAWVVSLFVEVAVEYQFGSGRWSVYPVDGDLNLHVVQSVGDHANLYGNTIGWSVRTLGRVDRFHFVGHFIGGYDKLYFQEPDSYEDDVSHLYCSLPIPLLLTVLLPLASGCLSRFRFPLWSYFAWTALVAAELAYYLR
jgi:hypothetical protein